MTGKHRATSGPLRKACYPPPPVARHYGMRIMCRLCSYFSPAQKSSAGLLPFKGRGPWLFVTQHGRHKSKSRNADFIIIARRAIPHPSGRRPVKLKNLKNPRLRNRRPLSPMNPGAPLWCLRHLLPAPLGSVSLDSQSPTIPCESSSLATASGGTIRRRTPYPV